MLTIFKGVALNRLTVRTVKVVVIMCAHFEFIQCVRFQRGDLHTLTCAADIINGNRLKDTPQQNTTLCNACTAD